MISFDQKELGISFHPEWLSFFGGVEITTNHICINIYSNYGKKMKLYTLNNETHFLFQECNGWILPKCRWMARQAIYSAKKQHKGMMNDVCRAPVRSDTLHFFLGAFRKLVGGLEHDFYFPIYWECHHPNWLSYFFRGFETTSQIWRFPKMRLHPNQPFWWDFSS